MSYLESQQQMAAELQELRAAVARVRNVISDEFLVVPDPDRTILVDVVRDALDGTGW